MLVLNAHWNLPPFCNFLLSKSSGFMRRFNYFANCTKIALNRSAFFSSPKCTKVVGGSLSVHQILSRGRAGRGEKGGKVGEEEKKRKLCTPCIEVFNSPGLGLNPIVFRKTLCSVVVVIDWRVHDVIQTGDASLLTLSVDVIVNVAHCLQKSYIRWITVLLCFVLCICVGRYVVLPLGVIMTRGIARRGHGCMPPPPSP